MTPVGATGGIAGARVNNQPSGGWGRGQVAAVPGGLAQVDQAKRRRRRPVPGVSAVRKGRSQHSVNAGRDGRGLLKHSLLLPQPAGHWGARASRAVTRFGIRTAADRAYRRCVISPRMPVKGFMVPDVAISAKTCAPTAEGCTPPLKLPESCRGTSRPPTCHRERACCRGTRGDKPAGDRPQTRQAIPRPAAQPPQKAAACNP